MTASRGIGTTQSLCRSVAAATKLGEVEVADVTSLVDKMIKLVITDDRSPEP